MKPNYPNPFNPVTTIQFDIPAEIQQAVSLQVYDISGRMVETLVNKKLEPGQYDIQWNASQHSSGVYLLRMNAGTFTQIQKLMLLK
ncbi:MAG: T9SS type A sorting domain-containing protein [Candidatus Marinimicrobia bacterium]|nr:T9SS type A sorting domain-containing protein [Candidatus Neomarinimicrobiota bacterium]